MRFYQLVSVFGVLIHFRFRFAFLAQFRFRLFLNRVVRLEIDELLSALLLRFRTETLVLGSAYDINKVKYQR